MFNTQISEFDVLHWYGIDKEYRLLINDRPLLTITHDQDNDNSPLFVYFGDGKTHHGILNVEIKNMLREDWKFKFDEYILILQYRNHELRIDYLNNIVYFQN